MLKNNFKIKIGLGILCLSMLFSSIEPLNVFATQKERVMNAAPFINARDIVITKGDKNTKIDGSGTIVAVFDSGLNIDHPALQNAPKNPKFTKEQMKEKIKEVRPVPWEKYDDESLDSMVPNEKVIFRYDISDRSAETKNLKDDHGMHVTGIVAANGKVDTKDDTDRIIQGIAPEAQIMFFKVFTSKESGEGLKNNDIFQYIRKAIDMGADVINLSLGTDSSVMSQLGLSPESVEVIDYAKKKGVTIVATSGNQGYFGNGYNMPLAKNPDYGVTATPALHYDLISVGSADNKKFVAGNLTLVDKPNFNIAVKKAYRGNYNLDSTPIEYVYLEDLSDESLQSANISGKLVVYERYKRDNDEVIKKAKELGARGIIVVYKSTFTRKSDYPFVKDKSLVDENFMILGVSYADKEYLRDAENKKVNIDFSKNEYDSPRAGELTSFTGLGVSSDLVFKPDLLSAGGIDVVSLTDRFEGDDKKYIGGVISYEGTSMAAPEVTGAVALVKQAFGIKYPNLQGEDLFYFIKNSLLNTSVPQNRPNGVYASPRHQGNGLINVKNAINSGVVIFNPKDTNDYESGYAKINLRELKSGEITLKYKALNYNETEKTYNPVLTLLRDEVKDKRFTLNSVDISEKVTNKEGFEEFTVPAGSAGKPGEKDITLKFTLSEEEIAKIKEEMKNGFFIDGFITFSPTDDSPVLETTFTGFYGDWINLKTFEDFVYDMPEDERPFYSEKDNRIYDRYTENGPLLRESYLNSSHLETNVKNKRGTFDRLALGYIPGTDPKEFKYSKDHLAISPNNDGMADSMQTILVLLRNFLGVDIDIVNEDNPLYKEKRAFLGSSDRSKDYYGGYPEARFTSEKKISEYLVWDGTIKQGESQMVVEGVYNYKISVKPDSVDQTNPATKNKASQIQPQIAEYKIKVDVTKPVLKSIDKKSEENNKTVFSIDAFDPKLKNTNKDGSGIAEAKIKIGDEITNLEIDPLAKNPFENKTFTIDTDKIKDAELILTDWAKNTLNTKIEPFIDLKEGGELEIRSNADKPKNFTVEYKVKNVDTGKIYKSYAYLPEGTYEVIPYNLAKGYSLVDTDKAKRTVRIIKGQKALVELNYLWNEEEYSLRISVRHGDDESEYVDLIHKYKPVLLIRNISTGVEYEVEHKDVAGGVIFNRDLPNGDYELEFINIPENVKYKFWNHYGDEIKVIKVDSTVEGHYVTLKENEEPTAPLESEEMPVTLAMVRMNENYTTVQAKAGSDIKIKLYTVNKTNTGDEYDFKGNISQEPKYEIDKTNTKIIEITDQNNPNLSTYFVDLNDEAKKHLDFYTVAKSEATKDGKTTEQEDYNIVILSEKYMNDKVNYLKEYIAKNAEKFSEEKARLDKLISDIDFNANEGGLVKFQGMRLTEGRVINAYNNNYAAYYYNELLKCMDELEKIILAKDPEFKIPVINIHFGYIDGSEFELFQDYMKNTTAIVTEDSETGVTTFDYFKDRFNHWEGAEGILEDAKILEQNLKPTDKPKDIFAIFDESVPEPIPEEPTPIEPTPEEPTPIEPTPVKPDPVIPTPEPYVPREPEIISENEGGIFYLDKLSPSKKVFSDVVKSDLSSISLKQNANNTNYMILNDNKFEPDRNITRIEVIKALSNLYNLDGNRESIKFDDLDENQQKLVDPFEKSGVIDGYNNKFNPKDSITRSELIKILSILKNIDLKDSTNSVFKDVNGHWAEKYINVFYELGIIQGYPDKSFKPDNKVTNAEFVTIINKLTNRTILEKSDIKISDVDENHWAYKQVITSVGK